MKLSVATWAVLDLLRLRFGVVLRLFDARLMPVVGEGLPALDTLMNEPGMRERCLAVIANADAPDARRVSRSIMTIPIHAGREVQGVLVATMPDRATRDLRDDELGAIDAAAQIARIVIEADLASSGELSATHETARRLQGILRFFGVLTRHSTESEMMQAVVQAATVWFDLDCRVYYRSDAETYSLYTALPGLDPHDLQQDVAWDRMRGIVAEGHVTRPEDLDDLGWHSRRGEALVLSFGSDPDWVLLIAGTITPDIELTFRAIAHVLTSSLDRMAALRDAHWRERLIASTDDRRATPERVASAFLDELSKELGGASVRLSVSNGTEQRTLATLWQGGSPERVLTQTFQLNHDSTATLDLSREAERPRFEEIAAARAWVNAMQLWLRGAAIAIEYSGGIAWDPEAQAFEHRIGDEVERAKRFNLGLALVLVRAEEGTALASVDPLLRIIRPELRASDLTGPVRGGMLAILLVHAAAEAVDAVVARVRRRLRSASPGQIRIGHAMFSPDCSTGDALIRCAQGQLRELPANP